jgi:hypothetical protein
MRIAGILTWCAWLGSILIMGEIEGHALSQPETPTGPYFHAHNFKGRVYFLTDKQEEVMNIAFPIFWGSGIIFVGLAFIAKRQTGRTKSN